MPGRRHTVDDCYYCRGCGNITSANQTQLEHALREAAKRVSPERSKSRCSLQAARFRDVGLGG